MKFTDGLSTEQKQFLARIRKAAGKDKPFNRDHLINTSLVVADIPRSKTGGELRKKA